MALTVCVVKPGRYSNGHQFTATDYATVPALSVRGQFAFWELVRPSVDRRVNRSEAKSGALLRMMLDSFERLKSKG